MSRIARAARLAVLDKLTDPDNGFNALLPAILTDAGITALPKGFRYPISFALPSKNFFMADVDPDDVEATSAITYPFTTLFTAPLKTTNTQKFQLFSGVVPVYLRQYLSWDASSVLPDFETIGDCFVEATIACFNAPGWAAWATGPVIYNGEIDADKSPLVLNKGKNWRQTLSYTLTTEVETT